MIPLSVLATLGDAPTATSDTVISSDGQGKILITHVPHAGSPAQPDLGDDNYSRLEWAALCGVLPLLNPVLVPSRACAAIPQLADAAREYILSHPHSPEFRASIINAPSDIRLLAAALSEQAVFGDVWDSASVAQALGIVQRT